MAFNYLLPLRIIQAVFTIIILGLTAYVIDKFNEYTYPDWSPDEVRFLLFTSLWTILVLIYLVLAPWKYPVAAHKFAIVSVEFVTMIFWFAGWIAVAAYIGDYLYCDTLGACAAMKAAAVFGAFEWCAFVATFVMAGLHVWRTRDTNRTEAPPQMQVHQSV